MLRVAFRRFSNQYTRTPEQCPSVVSLLAESYNPHVRYGAAMALGIACAGTGMREALNILEPMIKADRMNYVRQGALIASAMICIQHTEQTCPQSVEFREQYSKIIKDRHEDVMSKFGAILAQGIIDAGGRNVTLCMQSKSGHMSMLSVVGAMVFTQYWFWYPLSLCLSLAFTPSCIIGLNRDLSMPKISFKSNAKPSMFAYPPRTEEKKKDELVKTHSAILSLSRKGRREREKDRYLTLSERRRSRSHSAKKIKDGKDERDLDKKERTPERKERDRSTVRMRINDEPEADFEILENPARVMKPQCKMLEVVDNGNHTPIKSVNHGGIIMFKRLKAEEEEIVEFIQGFGPLGVDEMEPEPPEPFEWIDAY